MRTKSSERVIAGVLAIIAGAVPLLSALNVIPSDPESFYAPRWLVAICGGLFVLGGLYVLNTAVPARRDSMLGWLRRCFYNLTGVVVLTGFAIIGGWIAFASEDAAGGRWIFGPGAIFCALLALWGWFHLLTGNWQEPE